MAKASFPHPDDDLSPGLYEGHPLFSDDVDMLARYAEVVLIRHGLPSPRSPGVFDRDPEGRVTVRRLGRHEPAGAGSVTMLDVETLNAWIKQETARGATDPWEAAYAYALIDLVAVVRNDERLANKALDKECRDRRTTPGYPDAGVAAFKSAFSLGQQIGGLVTRWRVFWRHGEVISGDHPTPLRELLWSIVVQEQLEEQPRGPHQLAAVLSEERDLATELGMKLRAANAPSADRMGRIMSDMLSAIESLRPAPLRTVR